MEYFNTVQALYFFFANPNWISRAKKVKARDMVFLTSANSVPAKKVPKDNCKRESVPLWVEIRIHMPFNTETFSPYGYIFCPVVF